MRRLISVSGRAHSRRPIIKDHILDSPKLVFKVFWYGKFTVYWLADVQVVSGVLQIYLVFLGLIRRGHFTTTYFMSSHVWML